MAVYYTKNQDMDLIEYKGHPHFFFFFFNSLGQGTARLLYTIKSM